MNIRFGVSPIAWSNDDMPELGGATPLASILTDIHELGFAGVEMSGRFPREPAALQALLAPYRLDLIGGWYSGALLERDAGSEIVALQSHLALLESQGASAFVFAETSNAVHGRRDRGLRDSPRLAAADWARFGERMTRVADYIEARGLHFAYHHHLGTVVENADDLEHFLAATGPSVRLTLDTGHAALGGIDAVATIRRHPERIAHVHCKDVRRRVHDPMWTANASFLDGVLAGMFTVPGDGDLDFAAVAQALAEIDYAGWIVIEAEQDPAKADPRRYAETGLATLRQAVDNAGLSA